MSSPLLIAQEWAAQMSEGKVSPSVSDSDTFSFECTYPNGMPQSLDFTYQVKVEWDKGDQSLYLNTNPKGFRLRWWEHAHPFFDSLDKYAKLFLDSCDPHQDWEDEEENEIEYYRPQGTFYAHEVGEKRLTPRFESMIQYDDDESFGPRFRSCLFYSCHAFYLCRPLFYFIGVKGREPTAEEMMNGLIKKHSESQVLREDNEHGRDLPPPIFFPSGLFGGKISKLRPQ